MLCYIFLVTAKMSSYRNLRQYLSVLLFPVRGFEMKSELAHLVSIIH